MAEETTVSGDGLTFRVAIDRGAEGAPWLMFANSLMTDLTVWDRQAAAFAGPFNVLRYDQRGHGGTGVPASAPDFATLAGDAARILDAVGVARCSFVGLSMGVPTGLALFASRPDLIERLVLCDGNAATSPERGALWSERIAAARRDGMAPLAEQTLARWFSAGFLATAEAGRMRAVMEAMAVEGFAACATALQAYDLSEVTKRIDVPALLLAGERDGEVPRTMRRLAETIAGAAFVEIPNAGHIPNVERPADFDAALSGFLAG